jgi:hypothetical protein
LDPEEEFLEVVVLMEILGYLIFKAREVLLVMLFTKINLENQFLTLINTVQALDYHLVLIQCHIK